MNVYAILAGGALATLAIAEILISRQKAQMKKQFLEELAQQDAQKLGDGEKPQTTKPENDRP
jgi:hypothetical protein